MPLNPLVVKVDIDRKMWVVREGTTRHLMTDGMFQKYLVDYQKRAEMSFMSRLRRLYRELQSTSYKAVPVKGGYKIIPRTLPQPDETLPEKRP